MSTVVWMEGGGVTDHPDQGRPSPPPLGPGCGDRVLETSELRIAFRIVTIQHREPVQSAQRLGEEIFHYPVRGWAFFIASIKIFKT